MSEDGSAEAGSDYRRRRITVPFGRRDRAPRLVRIPIVHDTAAEPEETLRLRLSGPRCVNLGPRDEAEVTIEDDDRGVEPGGFAIGGAVSGLLGSGLVLDNQGDRLQVAGNGPFQFAGRRADQAIYDVRVASQPTNPDQVCTVANGAGTVAGADVTNIGVNCVTAPPVAGLDPSFGGDGKVSTPSGSAEAVAVQPDGAIVTAGNDSLGLDFQLMRHQPDGDLDPSFGGGDGIVTTSFGGPLGAPLSRDEAFDVALQPDGKILVAGSAQLTGTSLDFVVARYNPDGSPDTGFGGGDGFVTTDFGSGADVANGVAVQPDGRIVLAGHAGVPRGPGLGFDNDFAVARYEPDGDLDLSFSSDGRVTTDLQTFLEDSDLGQDVALQADGRIVVVGDHRQVRDFGLVRYEADGALDSSFGNGGVVIGDFAAGEGMRGVAVQPDGRIVVAGFSGAHGPNNDFALARYQPNGDLDSSFGTGDHLVTTDVSRGHGLGEDFAEDLVLQADGKIVAVGRNTTPAFNDIAVVRYASDGSLDIAFGDQGVLAVDFHGSDDFGQDIALQPDGKIVAAGAARDGSTLKVALMRLNP